MKTLLLAAGAAALALCSSSAFAAPSHKNGGPTVASPKQPIPYAELDSYMKASPKTRASKDWWSGETASAASGTSANASATASQPSTTNTAPK
jgi:molybdate transport system ATP-binding protein